MFPQFLDLLDIPTFSRIKFLTHLLQIIASPRESSDINAHTRTQKLVGKVAVFVSFFLSEKN